MSSSPPTRSRIAVVGSGVAGLAAAWALNEHSKNQYEVHLFEADDRPGGHANTVDYTPPGKHTSVKVDTGFIVFNTVTYPNFLLFLSSIQLPYITSNMSFSVSRDRGLYEWAGHSLFAQRRNLLNPGQWRLVWDIVRFNAGALEYLKKGDGNESIGTFLERGGFSEAFRDNYLLPMTAAIWSTPPDQAALDFPARTLLTFMHNHHLLQVLNQPSWLTLKDGSQSYVSRIISHLPVEQRHHSTRIQSASSSSGEAGENVTLESESGESWEFDHVIFACHADTTLKILQRGNGITLEEERILSSFEFGKNRAVLHSDPDLMPKRRSTWSAWNYLTFSDGEKANVNTVSLTYWMNLLQSIPESIHGLVAVTLNPPFEPAPDKLAGEWWYMHPLFSQKSINAQGELYKIQNKRGITFCGAWTKYGFHEDGFKSGLAIAVTYLSASPPFKVQEAQRDITIKLQDRILYSLIQFVDNVGRTTLDVPWRLCMNVLVFLFGVVLSSLGVVGIDGDLVKTLGVVKGRLEESRRVKVSKTSIKRKL